PLSVCRVCSTDPATTDIYTLSLHDALPIWPWPRMSGAERAAILRRVADGIVARKEELALLETLENGKPLAQSRSEIEGAADLWQDRKSTRLNSSHVSISYAVFCLKKKK